MAREHNRSEPRSEEEELDTVVEIRKVRNSIFDFTRDPNIEIHHYGEDGEWKFTHRAWVTKAGQPSLLGWRLIKLAIEGHSFRYIARHTGIDYQVVGRLFRQNEIIREAVRTVEQDVINDAISLLIRNIRKVTHNLITIATGRSCDSAQKQQAQLAAIKEYFSRISFGTRDDPRGNRTASLDDERFKITLEGKDAKKLGVLIERRDRRGERLLNAAPATEVSMEGVNDGENDSVVEGHVEVVEASEDYSKDATPRISDD